MDAIEIGTRLRDLRLKKGLSQGDIERSTGVLRCRLSVLENGRKGMPGIETLLKICTALGITLFEFFGGIPSETRPTLCDADREFLIEIQRHSLGAKQKAQLIEIAKRLASPGMVN